MHVPDATFAACATVMGPEDSHKLLLHIQQISNSVLSSLGCQTTLAEVVTRKENMFLLRIRF